MVLRLRTYIAASVFLHALFLAAFTFNFKDFAKTTKPASTMTLRSRSKSSTTTSSPAKKVAKTPTTKPVPKIIPVLRPDVEEASVPQAPSEPDSGDQNNVTNGAASDSDGGGGGGTDLSSDASLKIETLVKPEYTREALKARIQGLFAVDIHVDENGKVLEVEIIQSPGFGMDERIIVALKNAQFSPKKNGQGKGLETWVTIQFKLEIP